MPTRGRASAESHPAFNERQFRDALAQFVTGVTVVCAPPTTSLFVGSTANSFTSFSLRPPLVLWSLAIGSTTLSASFVAAQRYSINVLSAAQQDLAVRFSRRP